MSFANDQAAALFAAVALLCVVFLLGRRSRRRAAERFAEPYLLVHLTPRGALRAEKRRAAAFLAACSLCILALMRPQSILFGEASGASLDVLFAIDTSKSMLAEDVSPSRLEAAK